MPFVDLPPFDADAVRVLPPHERIVDAARTLFCRDGIHATGINRILHEAGVSKMTLYTHFGSKEALLREVLLREGTDWRSMFFGAVEGAGPDAAARLRGVVPALRLWFTSDRFFGCAFMNTAAEHTKGGEATWLRDMTRGHHAAILAFLAGLAAEAGYDDPAMLARQVLLLVDGTTAALMVSGDAAVLDVAARNLQAILVRPGG